MRLMPRASSRTDRQGVRRCGRESSRRRVNSTSGLAAIGTLIAAAATAITNVAGTVQQLAGAGLVHAGDVRGYRIV
jgi:hypothetical protein